MSRPPLANFELFDDLVPLKRRPVIPTDEELDRQCDALMRTDDPASDPSVADHVPSADNAPATVG